MLDREEEPDFYKKDGQAQTKGYGKSRRYIENLDEVHRFLKSIKIKSQIYSPGNFNLQHQINTIYRSKGILGIKGAEFLNILFLNINTYSIMFIPEDMNTPPVQQNLAKALGLNFFTVKLQPGNIQNIQPIDFLPILKL